MCVCAYVHNSPRLAADNNKDLTCRQTYIDDPITFVIAGNASGSRLIREIHSATIAGIASSSRLIGGILFLSIHLKKLEIFINEISKINKIKH